MSRLRDLVESGHTLDKTTILAMLDMVDRLETAEQQVARVRFLMSDFQANGNSRELSDPTAAVWHEAALQILRALDGDTRD